MHSRPRYSDSSAVLATATTSYGVLGSLLKHSPERRGPPEPWTQVCSEEPWQHQLQAASASGYERYGRGCVLVRAEGHTKRNRAGGFSGVAAGRGGFGVETVKRDSSGRTSRRTGIGSPDECTLEALQVTMFYVPVGALSPEALRGSTGDQIETHAHVGSNDSAGRFSIAMSLHVRHRATVRTSRRGGTAN